VSRVILEEETFENFCIFLKAFESLVSEFPAFVKSILLCVRLVLLGEKIKLAGKFEKLPKFFF